MSTTQSIAERLREVADMYCRGVQAFVDLRRIADEIEQRDSDVDGWTQTVTVDGSRQRWELPADDESVRKVLAPLFRFPHDPPRVGDERLVVETWPSTHAAASAENLKHLKRITTLEADRDELLRLLERAVSPGTGRYMSDGWLKDALAAIERQKGGG